MYLVSILTAWEVGQWQSFVIIYSSAITFQVSSKPIANSEPYLFCCLSKIILPSGKCMSSDWYVIPCPTNEDRGGSLTVHSFDSVRSSGRFGDVQCQWLGRSTSIDSGHSNYESAIWNKTKRSRSRVPQNRLEGDMSHVSLPSENKNIRCTHAPQSGCLGYAKRALFELRMWAIDASVAAWDIMTRIQSLHKLRLRISSVPANAILQCVEPYTYGLLCS